MQARHMTTKRRWSVGGLGFPAVVIITGFILLWGAWSVSALGEAAAGRDMTLQESVATALQNNVQVRIGRQELDEAQIRWEQAQASHLVQPSPVTLLQAEAGVAMAEQQVSLSALEVAIEVESDYYNILRLRNVLQVLDEATAVARRQEDIAGQRLDAGAGTKADLLAAEAEVARNEGQLANTRNNLDLALAKYRQTVGDPDAVPAPMDVGEAGGPRVGLEIALEEAMDRRLELTQLQTAIAAAEKELELATNDYTPGLTREAARVQLELHRLRMEQARNGIRLEVRSAYYKLQEEERRITVTEKELAEAQERLRVTEALFRADMATQVDLMGAQTGLTAARTEAIHACFDAELARAEFFRTLAWTLEDRENWEKGTDTGGRD